MSQRIDAKNKRVFLDTDVLISSLISKTGAAWYLINEIKNLNIFTNTATISEFQRIAKRNNLEIAEKLIEKLSTKKKEVQVENLGIFLNDPNDKHILEGAITSSSEYLITYNKKDYKVDSIRNFFNIIVMNPAEFMQYLRSLN